MALSDADFLLQFNFDDAAVFVEADRRTVYAYAGKPKDGEANIDGKGWLFNLVDAPQEFGNEAAEGDGPRNPQRFSRPFDRDREVREDAFTVTEIEVSRHREWIVEYDGKPIGLVWLGADPGCSAFAVEDSPVASTMPPYAAE